MTILEIENVTKRFQGISALDRLSLAIESNRLTALVGPNGAGKSTVVNVVSGFIRPDEGHVRFRARRIEHVAPHRIARLGIVRSFQRPRIFVGLTVLESAVLAATPPEAEGFGATFLDLLGRPRPRRREDEARALASLETCRLAHRADEYAGNLSYGEQKLLMLAQLLTVGGELLCLDELCAGLSGTLAEQVKGVMRDLVRQGKTILFIEHNLELVRELADWVVFLHQGQLVSEGETGAVLQDPRLVKLYLGQ